MSKKTNNRVQPAIANKIPMPPSWKTTYGAGEGQGGGSVAAKDSGNRKSPAIANKIGLPPSYDAYFPKMK